MSLSRFNAVLCLLLAACGPAGAQDVTTLKKDMIGQWELATTERSKTCVVTLKGDTAPQGFKLELEPACAAALPFTKDITGWSIKGLGDIVRLHNAAGETVIDFTEVETGIFEGMRTNEGVYILQNLAAARSLAKSMDQMIGDWSMVRGKRPGDLHAGADQHRRRQRQFPGVPERQMRSRGRGLQPDHVAARSRPDDPDVGQGPDLAVRGRRQRPVAPRPRQRRPADHAAGAVGRCSHISGATWRVRWPDHKTAVVPAKAGTHSHDAGWLQRFGHSSFRQLTPVVMGPCFRRDDDRGGAVSAFDLHPHSSKIIPLPLSIRAAPDRRPP
ncbi:hypothetical protein ACVWY5_007425 [Bradyrhizobium sp. USDA 3256]